MIVICYQVMVSLELLKDGTEGNRVESEKKSAKNRAPGKPQTASKSLVKANLPILLTDTCLGGMKQFS